jgi:hypothetical protein
MHIIFSQEGFYSEGVVEKEQKTGEGEELPRGDIALVREQNLVKWSRVETDSRAVANLIG